VPFAMAICWRRRRTTERAMIPPLTNSRMMSVERKVYRYNVAGGGEGQPCGSGQGGGTPPFEGGEVEETLVDGPIPCALDPTDEDEDEDEVADGLKDEPLAEDLEVVDDDIARRDAENNAVLSLLGT